MAIIQALANIGIEAEFYNIDFFRPTRDEVREYFASSNYDVIGISAVVSTAYEYTKWLSGAIREVLPDVVIILGGNLGASAEILLRKTEVDVCVVGDGEIIIQNLVNAIRKAPMRSTFKESFQNIEGICYLDESNDFIFTGYGPRPDKKHIEYPDYRILEKDGSVDYFFPSDGVFDLHLHASDRHKTVIPAITKSATVMAAKGCVARCTFCHRWEKGYRAKSVEEIISHIRYLQSQYGIDAITFSDENFGADRELTRGLAEELGKLRLPWKVAGVRARTVTRDDLKLWAENGCLIAHFGIESGSQKILDVMEKQATVEENINALKWTGEAGIATIIQLVIGMPGEDDKTIKETTEFLTKVSPYILEWKFRPPSELISINYAQALPGTPLYEYLREQGKIGRTLQAEESYLLRISDTDAYKDDHFINCTDSPLLKVLMWRWIILSELDAHHFRFTQGKSSLSLKEIFEYYLKLILVKIGLHTSKDAALQVDPRQDLTFGGYFNVQRTPKLSPLLLNRLTRPLFYPVLAIFVAFFKGGSFSTGIPLIASHTAWSMGFNRRKNKNPEMSLRKIVKISKDASAADESPDMVPLRLGR
ncbi:B12-binding domain-containing radical SAM protein [Polynucleobacter sp. MWH-UH2A]|uniref:B12-binding domain-containing radical SAM protein n=1 Tax=Polynucleobacter sp. MWH-UH2A TaxID=1855617 RepID=UPI001BFDB7AA|nr:B12-binding domain-containing radical SAM protein [Polynucleobacter sp. MWH-UH2A]